MGNGKYVERGNELVYQPPFDADDVRFYGFLMNLNDAEKKDNKLQRLCDKYLNEPTGYLFNFRPFPLPLLVFCTLGRMQSKVSPDWEKGWIRENEAAFWLLVINGKTGDLRWFHPYMVVDNSHAFAMGRELYGFAKSMGRFDIPDDPAAADNFRAYSEVFRKFDKGARQLEEEIISVYRVSDTVSDDKSEGDKLKEVLAMLDEYLKDRIEHKGPFHKLGVEQMLHALVSIPMIFLKQFRDVKHPDKACYQSLVEVGADLNLDKPIDRGLLRGNYAVNVSNFDSFPFCDDFGFPCDIPVKPVISFWTTFNFTMGEGVEIWRAS